MALGGAGSGTTVLSALNCFLLLLTLLYLTSAAWLLLRIYRDVPYLSLNVLVLEDESLY